MRTATLTTLCLLAAIAAACGSGGPATPKDQAKDVILKVIELARAGDAEAAAPLIVYRGPDRERKWKDVYDAASDADLEEVRRAITEIRGEFGDGNPSFGNYETERESEGVWHRWAVTFDGGKTLTFCCLDTPKGMALGDIDD